MPSQPGANNERILPKKNYEILFVIKSQLIIHLHAHDDIRALHLLTSDKLNNRKKNNGMRIVQLRKPLANLKIQAK